MAKGKGMSSRVIAECANLTGRSDAEIKLILGAAMAAVAATLAIQTAKILVDIGPPPRRGTDVSRR
jgi:hypothetical protein